MKKRESKTLFDMAFEENEGLFSDVKKLCRKKSLINQYKKLYYELKKEHLEKKQVLSDAITKKDTSSYRKENTYTFGSVRSSYYVKDDVYTYKQIMDTYKNIKSIEEEMKELQDFFVLMFGKKPGSVDFIMTNEKEVIGDVEE